jgi:hypothetical protein
MTLFRRGGHSDRARTAGRQLAVTPGEAHRQLLDMLDGRTRQQIEASAAPAMLARRRRANG